MLWVVQEDFYAKSKRYNLLDVLSRLNIPFVEVAVNNNKIEPDISVDVGENVITNGSIMLSNIGKSKGWVPGSLFNDNFSYKKWSEHYGDLLINKNARLSTLENAVFNKEDEQLFVRPILDNKSFSGKVFRREEFLKFRENSMYAKKGFPSPDVEILLSKPKKIGQEHRHYIVDGEIITSSRYKLAGQPNFKEGCDIAVLDVVKKAIAIWQPARAFVLDTYINSDEIGIVEIGCICHAGIYEADLLSLVAALDNMDFTKNIKNNKKKQQFMKI